MAGYSSKKLFDSITVSANGAVGKNPNFKISENDALNLVFLVDVTGAATAGTLQLETSIDGGTTWRQHGSTVSLAATGKTHVEIDARAGTDALLGPLARFNVAGLTGSATFSLWITRRT